MSNEILRRLCGQLLVVGFDGQEPPGELQRRVQASEVGAVMLFRPNIGNAEGLAALVRILRASAPAHAPLPVAIDQEGGLVQRLRTVTTVWPDMFSVGAENDLNRTEAVGQAMGRELAALGIGWSFGPVLDVQTNPKNPIIGNRAFATSPREVAEQAMAYIRGLRSAGVVACGKHFPGHGDTRVDSHLDLPVVEHDAGRLRAVELMPFVSAVAAGLESFMTAHVMYPALDPQWPATMSRAIATSILRDEMGFRGLLASDDLGMKAVAARWSIDEIVLQGLRAGVDVFLIREDEARQRAAFEALVRGAEADSEIRARVEQSAMRMARFKEKLRVGLPLEGPELHARLRSAEHKALAESFARVSLPGAEAVATSEVAQG